MFPDTRFDFLGIPSAARYRLRSETELKSYVSGLEAFADNRQGYAK
jgi:hypothetical protein